MSAPAAAAARILLVEDDENLRVTLTDNLEEQGYAVEAVNGVAAARDAFGRAPADLVILDLMLQDGDGYALCRWLRASGHATRVLMLTARTLEEDVVRGFEAGADDYVAKPYRLRELFARVAALLRRAAATEHLGFAGFSIDLAARQLTGPTGLIDLTRTELDLLALLVRNRNRALTRDQILDAVWGADVVVDSRTVDNFILSLRRKLGWSDTARFRFRAIRGVGYRMEIDEG
jgi:DNA-binding response OmpR family regulator